MTSGHSARISPRHDSYDVLAHGVEAWDPPENVWSGLVVGPNRDVDVFRVSCPGFRRSVLILHEAGEWARISHEDPITDAIRELICGGRLSTIDQFADAPWPLAVEAAS